MRPRQRTLRRLTRQRFKWLVLSAVPSSLMLGVTTHVSTDVAPVPLFWVLPLAMYLGTFVLVISSSAVDRGKVAHAIASPSRLRLHSHDSDKRARVVADSAPPWDVFRGNVAPSPGVGAPTPASNAT